MRSVIRLFCSLFTASLLVGASPSGDKPTPERGVREESRVVVVEVPVNVVAGDGRPVQGLTAADFQVFDDGKAQTITGFEVLDQRAPLPARAAADSAINPAARRHFLLVFDLSFASARGVVAARKSARDFVVNRMKELDTAAVATYSVETGFRLLIPFTGDRSQLAATLETLGLPNLAQRSPDPVGFLVALPNRTSDGPFATAGNSGDAIDAAMGETIENIQTMYQKSARSIYRDRVTRMLDSFAKLAVSLDAVPGRKHILYLSEGFDSRELSGGTGPNAGAKEGEWALRGQTWKLDNDVRYGNTDLKEMMTRALALFNRSDCTIHSIDIGGLRTNVSVVTTESPVDGQESLYAMAEQTGGVFLKNANDLGPGLEKLLERTGLVYVLAFQPVRIPENGKFHTLKVKVKDRSWRVSARSGYYEPKTHQQLTPIERKLVMTSAIASATPKSDLPAWVVAVPFPNGKDPARVPVVVEIPGDRLLAKHDGPAMNVEVTVYAIDAKGTTRDFLYQPVGLDLTRVRSTLQNGGLKIYGELALPPGQYMLRTLVRDAETDRFGVTVSALNVPSDPAAAFALPPLFLEEGRQWIMVKAKPHGTAPAVASEYPFSIDGEAFIPTALAGTSRSGEAMQVCMIGYNFSQTSDLQYTGRAIGVDGKTHGRVELKLLKASDREHTGARKLLLQVKTWGLDPGRYALNVRLDDAKAGRTAENSFPFDVK
ncbi:MAG: VWA domain-containing protein [Acidobacteria bacterium]|nr:VWA domain-containing protein [Acidobacteriota bacterium]MCA1610308.1 VWA domain-containing protein [Acidobacteriota bacterium]